VWPAVRPTHFHFLSFTLGVGAEAVTSMRSVFQYVFLLQGTGFKWAIASLPRGVNVVEFLEEINLPKEHTYDLVTTDEK
jgi:hypothetical protein